MKTWTALIGSGNPENGDYAAGLPSWHPNTIARTRGGSPVKIIAVLDTPVRGMSIIGICDDEIDTWTKDGRYMMEGPSCLDLVCDEMETAR